MGTPTFCNAREETIVDSTNQNRPFYCTHTRNEMTDDKSFHHLIQTVLTLWKMVQKPIVILLTDVDKNFKLLHVIKSLLFLELHVYFGFISLLILNAIYRSV